MNHLTYSARLHLFAVAFANVLSQRLFVHLHLSVLSLLSCSAKQENTLPLVIKSNQTLFMLHIHTGMYMSLYECRECCLLGLSD